ncbi:MAG TPA: VWA domain-containing protein, partial [Pirellulales bacterium]
LREQRAMGGTILNPAIEAAYRYHDNDRQLNVVVLSDGMTEQGLQRELLELIDRRPSGVSVFCIGVGNEVNRPLLAQLANKTGGLAAFMSTGANFEAQAQAFRRKLTRPAATGVKIALEGAGVYDVEPEVLPNLYHGQPVRLYGRYKTAGPATIAVKAEVLGSPLEKSLAVALPATDATNPEIERMWASHRVERLMAAGRADGSNGHADEIVRLCEGYSIASQYASFIVLENDAEYQRWKIARRNATRVQRDRQAQLAVREGLAQLRRDTAQKIGPKGDAKPAGENNSAGNAGKPEPQALSKKRTESEFVQDARGNQTLRLARSRADDSAMQPERATDRFDGLAADEANADGEVARRPTAGVPAGDGPTIDGPTSNAARTPAAASAPAADATGSSAPQGGGSGGGGTGGGAIDPLTALAAASLAAFGWAARRKRDAAMPVDV